jgi:hypothetical protein
MSPLFGVCIAVQFGLGAQLIMPHPLMFGYGFITVELSVKLGTEASQGEQGEL